MNKALEDLITSLQEQWIPKVHCSNCINCKVYRDEDTEKLMAYCTVLVHAMPKPLEKVISRNSKGWKKANNCPDYDDMDN